MWDSWSAQQSPPSAIDKSNIRMIKLFLKTKSAMRYHEAWISGSKVVEHWGGGIEGTHHFCILFDYSPKNTWFPRMSSPNVIRMSLSFLQKRREKWHQDIYAGKPNLSADVLHLDFTLIGTE